MSNTSPQGKQNLIIVYLALFLLPLIFFNTTEGMIKVWIANETFTHGFLIFPISAWLIWQNRTLVCQTQSTIEPWVLLLIIPAFSIWYISSIVDVQITQQFALIALIVLTIWFLLGHQLFKLLLFPLAFLFFAVPFGQSLIPPLMEFTANVTVMLVHLTGIPIYQDGLTFTLPSGNWSVVEECSGVRYLIASLVLGTLFAHISYSSKKKFYLFILVSILVPIIANSLRAFGIVMIGHLSGMTLATGVDHLVYGWIFFGIVIFVLFLLGSYWADPLETFKQPPAKNLTRTPTSKMQLFSVSLITLLVLFAASLSVKFDSNNPQSNVKLNLPNHFAEWQYQIDRALEWQPIITNPDQEISRSYLFNNDLVQLNIGYFQHQNNHSEAVSTMNHIASPLGGNWKKVRGSDVKTDRYYVTETEIQYRDNKVLVWNWYQIGSFTTPNPYIAKLFDAYNQIIHKRKDAAMITISTNITFDKASSEKTLNQFMSIAEPAIHKIITELQ